MSTEGEITRLLEDLRRGKDGAEDALIPLLYDELHAMARRFMREEYRGHTLQTTALVHEAYLRMGGRVGDGIEDKVHFLRLAARTMRHVLIDHARKRRAEKRGGKAKRISIQDLGDIEGACGVDLVALEEALERLGALDPKLVQVVELRFFAGLTVEETAKVLGIAPRTVLYDWRMAKAWLRNEMGVS